MYKTHTGNEGNRNQSGDLLYGLIVQRAVLQQTVTIGVVAGKLPTTPLSLRKSMYIFNNGTSPIFLGNSLVTILDGFPVYPHASVNIQIEDGIDVYAISSVAGQDIRILEGA